MTDEQEFLRARFKGLWREKERLTKIAQKACDETFEKQTEINQLRAENERLTALLTTSTALMERVDARAAFGQQWGDAIAANRAALEPKP